MQAESWMAEANRHSSEKPFRADVKYKYLESHTQRQPDRVNQAAKATKEASIQLRLKSQYHQAVRARNGNCPRL